MARRLFALTVLSVLAHVASGAHAYAEEPASSSSLAAPALKLEVTPAANGPWSMKLSNTGDTPVRVAADPRLLSFDLLPASGVVELDKVKKGTPAGPPRCVLPDDARPTTDEGRELVIPAKRSWSTTFDPLFYCFGARERAALVKDTQVKAHFGWKTPVSKAKVPPPSAPPFAVTPIGASVGKVAPVKELDADAVTLTDSVTLAPKTPPSTVPSSSDEAAPPNVYLTVPETMDAAKGGDLSTTVTLVNDSDRPITLLFRPDMVMFGVSGPAGSVSCGTPRTLASPPRELFVTIGSKGKASLAILFTSTCPDGTFDTPGLYRVTPKLDATNTSGRSINIKSWDAVATAKAPLLLRIRQPKRPSLTGARPALD